MTPAGDKQNDSSRQHLTDGMTNRSSRGWDRNSVNFGKWFRYVCTAGRYL